MGLINNISLWMLNSRTVKRSSKFFANWGRVQSVLILAHASQLPELSAFVDMAEKEGKTVSTLFIYKGKPEQAPSFKYKGIPVSTKELTMFGLPKDEVISRLNAKPPDVLISLGAPDDIALLALSKLSSAPCRIARFENPIFDMSISTGTPMEPRTFLEQVYTYLNMIKN